MAIRLLYFHAGLSSLLPKVLEGDVFSLSVHTWGGGGTLSPSHNTSTGSMFFRGVLQLLIPGPYQGVPLAPGEEGVPEAPCHDKMGTFPPSPGQAMLGMVLAWVVRLLRVPAG